MIPPDRTNSNICCTIGKLPSIHLSGNKCGKIYSIFCMGSCVSSFAGVPTVPSFTQLLITVCCYFTITDNSSHIQPCTNRNIIRDRLQRIVLIPAVTKPSMYVDSLMLPLPPEDWFFHRFLWVKIADCCASISSRSAPVPNCFAVYVL